MNFLFFFPIGCVFCWVFVAMSSQILVQVLNGGFVSTRKERFLLFLPTGGFGFGWGLGSSFQRSPNLDFLGTKFGSKLSFEDQVCGNVSRVSQRIGILRLVKHICVDTSVLLRCYIAFLLLLLEYICSRAFYSSRPVCRQSRVRSIQSFLL